MARVLIIACGNSLRGDDGAGWRIAEALVEQPSVTAGAEVIFSPQLTPELSAKLSETQTAVFVDAGTDLAPGEIAFEPVEPSRWEPGATLHYLSPANLLSMAQIQYGAIPQHAFTLTVGGEQFGYSEKLSEPVLKAIPEAVTRIVECVASASKMYQP